MKNIKLFISAIFGILLAFVFPIPAFAHGGMVGFGDGLMSVFLLVAAFILFLPSMFAQNPGTRVLVMVCNIFLGFCALMLSLDGTNTGLELFAALFFGFNILWGALIGASFRKKENENINTNVNFIEMPEDPQMLAKVDVNARDEKGRTSLIIAVCNNYKDIIETIIDNGADINAQDNEGKTALIWAACKDYYDIHKMLLFKGANPFIEDKNGKAALDYASDRLLN